MKYYYSEYAKAYPQRNFEDDYQNMEMAKFVLMIVNVGGNYDRVQELRSLAINGIKHNSQIPEYEKGLELLTPTMKKALEERQKEKVSNLFKSKERLFLNSIVERGGK